MLRSYSCDNSDACIFVKETITLLGAAANENDKAEKECSIYIMYFKNQHYTDRQRRRSCYFHADI